MRLRQIIVLIKRVRINESPSPTAIPNPAMRAPCPSTIRNKSLGCAPNAMRIPISFMRSFTS